MFHLTFLSACRVRAFRLPSRLYWGNTLSLVLVLRSFCPLVHRSRIFERDLGETGERGQGMGKRKLIG